MQLIFDRDIIVPEQHDVFDLFLRHADDRQGYFVLEVESLPRE